jgi:hypothetical protein
VFHFFQEFPEPESLIHAKSQKKLIVTAAARFNTKPKQGVAFLEENQLIYTDLPADAPESAKAHNLAVFLKGCARLDKRLLGDYLSREENLPLLKAFMGLFDFRNVCSFVSFSLIILIFFFSETDRRCDARTCGDFPTPGRGPADCSHHGDVRVSLFRFRARLVVSAVLVVLLKRLE